MSQSSDEEDATLIQTEETLMHRETPGISSKATPIEDEDDDEVILKNIKTEDRLEDVFQDETIKAFTMIEDFEKFARSERGLFLEEYDLTCIKENEKKVESQKMAMLNRWREINGPKATAMKIRFLVEHFRNHLDPNSKDFIKLSNGAFVMYVKKTLGDGYNVFLGEQTSEVEGCSHPCVIKLTFYNKVSLREAQALTKLRDHENVVSILRAGKYIAIPRNYIYIAMNLAWTRRLRDVLEECKQLDSVDQIINLYSPLDFVFQILKGLVHIHDHWIIHRDLKPENVLVSKDYKNIKLNDFGICKPIDDGCTTKQTTQGIGTEGYSSPETYDASVISLSSDVYSVGIMIAEMISNGRHPFGDNPDLWKHHIKQKMDPDLSHLCISNKSQMEELLKQMMHPNPKKRPTAMEVLNDAALKQAQIVFPLSFKSLKEQSTTQKEITVGNEDKTTSMSETDEKHDFHVEEITVGDGDETTFMSETDKIHDLLVEERGRCLAEESKFHEAISIFEELESAENSDLGMNLLTAECYIQLGKEKKAQKEIKKVEKIIMKPRMCDVQDVISLAQNFTENCTPVRALLLLRIAGDMFKQSTLSPDEIVKGIFRCITKMNDPVRALLEFEKNDKQFTKLGLEEIMETRKTTKRVVINKISCVIAIDYGVGVMEEMLDDLRTVEGADPGIIAFKQAVLCNMINSNYSKIGQHGKALKLLKLGLDHLKNYYGKNVCEHQIYITMLTNIAAEYHNSQKFNEAKQIQLKVLREINYVLDFDNEEERIVEVTRIQDALKMTLQHIKLS